MNFFKKETEPEVPMAETHKHPFEVKYSISVKGLGFPVLHWLELYESNSKRFGLRREKIDKNNMRYTLTDRLLNRSWTLTERYISSLDSDYICYIGEDYLTNVEKEILVKIISYIRQDRKNKITEIKTFRKRQKIANLYNFKEQVI